MIRVVWRLGTTRSVENTLKNWIFTGSETRQLSWVHEISAVACVSVIVWRYVVLFILLSKLKSVKWQAGDKGWKANCCVVSQIEQQTSLGFFFAQFLCFQCAFSWSVLFFICKWTLHYSLSSGMPGKVCIVAYMQSRLPYIIPYLNSWLFNTQYTTMLCTVGLQLTVRGF